MTRSQSRFIAYFMTLIMLAGVWAPFAASAMMTNDQQMEHKHSAKVLLASLVSANEKLSLNSEPTCNACDMDMGDQNQDCSDSCCQSCVNCSGVATFLDAHIFPAQHVSVKPLLLVTTNLSVNSQLLERPPRNI